MQKFVYRPDIDGLRAIAVLSVIAYHSNNELLGGGYVGVDIFFVISGYLITSTILRDIDANIFSFRKFYDRRIRRIFPALFFVLAISSIIAYIILFPKDLYGYSKSLISSLFFVSNIYFWRTTGYFSPTAETNPLLHTWSLSIEEQFYLLFPIYILTIKYYFKKPFRKKIIVGIIIIFFTSISLSIWGVDNKAIATFYWLPTRAWEFIIGVFLACLPSIKIGMLYRNFISASGLILIAYSVYHFNENTSFPGINALPPCLGTMAIIYANHLKNNNNLISRILTTKPFVFTGITSYSLYLWHWPIIVFYEHYTLKQPTLLFTLCTTFPIAILSWKYIEEPSRKHINFFSLYLILSIIFIALLIFSAYVHSSKGIPERLPKEIYYMHMGGEEKLRTPHRKKCFSWPKGGLELNKIKHGSSCIMGSKKQKSTSFALIGDSHAYAIFTGISLSAKKSEKKGIFFGYSGCTPIQGMLSKRSSKYKCEEYKKTFYQKIYSNSNIQKVIFSARWANYLYGNTYGLGTADPRPTPTKHLLRLSHQPEQQLSTKERELYFASNMQKTILSLVNSGKDVVIVSSIPEVGHHVPRYVARKYFSSIQIEKVNNHKYFYIRQRFLLNLFSNLDKIDGVTIIYPHIKLCVQEQSCLYQINGQPLYYDDDHLSVRGATYISPIFDSLFTPQ